MIQPGIPNTRHTIPRWNAINTSFALGEMDSYNTTPKNPIQNQTAALEKLLDEWKREKSLPLAVEIISTSKFVGDNIDISDIRCYIANLKSSGIDLPVLVKQLICEQDDSMPERVMPLNYRNNISNTKKSLYSFQGIR